MRVIEISIPRYRNTRPEMLRGCISGTRHTHRPSPEETLRKGQCATDRISLRTRCRPSIRNGMVSAAIGELIAAIDREKSLSYADPGSCAKREPARATPF